MSFSKPLCIALLSMTALTSACTNSSDTNNQAAAVEKKGTVSGLDLAGRNMAVAPGDDFDEYANGGWRKTTEIPADRSNTGIFYQVFQKAEKRNAEIIEGAAKSNPAANTDARRIADYYTAFMDTNGMEKRGTAPIQPELQAIGAIVNKSDLSRALGAGLRADVDPLNATNYWTRNLLGLFVTQGLGTPDKNVPYLLQGGLGMPDRDYYLSADPEMVKIRTAYRAYLTDLLKLAGVADADAKAGRVYDLETKIARAQASVVDTQDVAKANNPWKRADFAAKAPGIDWDAYLKAASLDGQSDFIIWQPKAVSALSALVASEPLDTWKEWMTVHKINDAAPYLNKALDDRYFAFYSTTLNGVPQQRTRDKRAISLINTDLGDAVGHIYADKYFPASAKADVQGMVKNILAAFDRRVAALDWMAPATKEEARRKISTLRVGVGYPESWRDYASLVIRADDPYGNKERSKLAEYHHQLAKLGAAVDRGEWWMNPQTVNAVNLPLQNALNFPAAILDAPFYDPNADPAANYGSIGAVIGHEISHSFDDSGSQFDSKGMMRNWWTPADLAHFKQASADLAKQYDAYEPLPGLHLKGQQVLGENIADVAGLAAALDAYHASLGGKPAPVIDGLTGDQRFFLAFAQSWREKVRDAALRSQIATNGHSPGRFRAQTVRNLDAWYDAYAVKPGQKLYLDPAKRVRVW